MGFLAIDDRQMGDAHGPTHVAAIRSCSFRSSLFVFPRSAPHRETGHRSVAPLTTAARAGRNVVGTNQTDKTNTNGYPYCVPIVDSEEP